MEVSVSYKVLLEVSGQTLALVYISVNVASLFISDTT